MNPYTRGPMSAPGGQSSDSHIHMDPAIHPKDSLPRTAALAWERVAFAKVFDHPEPGLRIRRFLDKG